MTFTNEKIVAIFLLLGYLCFVNCQKWDLERVDFLEISMETVEEIQASSIVAKGTIKGLSTTIIAEHGHCWSSDNEMPLIEVDDKTTLGIRGGNGTYLSNIQDLQSNQQYFIRAYAIWEDKTYYSAPLSFRTGIELTTDSIFYLAGSEGHLFGTIQNLDGNVDILQHGHVWSTKSTLPTILDEKSSLGSTSKNGAFYSHFENLPIGFTIFFRTYVQLTNGQIFYGKPLSINTIPANVWVQLKDFPGGFGWSEPSVFVIDNKAYFGTGEQNGTLQNKFWVYNPIMDSWKKLKDFPGVLRRQSTSFSINDKGYMGLGRVNIFPYQLNDFWEYDPITDNWVEVMPFPERRSDHEPSFVLQEKGYVFLSDKNQLFSFDPNQGNWTSTGLFEVLNRRNYAVTFVLEENAFIATGRSRSSGTNEFWRYDLINNEWIQKTAFPGEKRYAAFGFVIDGKGYLGGGFGATTFDEIRDFWSYDPISDKWEAKPDFVGKPTTFLTAFSIGSRGYVHHWDGTFWVYISR